MGIIFIYKNLNINLKLFCLWQNKNAQAECTTERKNDDTKILWVASPHINFFKS